MSHESNWFKSYIKDSATQVCSPFCSPGACKGSSEVAMVMSSVLLCLSLVMTATQASYDCQRSYTPSKNIGYPRVPTNCFATVPSACPRSWKSGIPEGRATSTPLVYSEFLICHEAFSTCGYVPINPRNGDVRGNSGVTIGAGVDLGSGLIDPFQPECAAKIPR